jgi:dTMP kinase
MPLITIEGIDGSGKSTAIVHIQHILKERGQDVLVVNDFNACPVSRLLKPLMLGETNPWAQYALVAAARVATNRAVVARALVEGLVVIYDRYVDTTYAYQGTLGVDAIRIAEDHAQCELPHPDLVLVLDVPVPVARARKGEPHDRIEAMHEGFFHQVRHAYLGRASKSRIRHAVVDANRPVEDVVAECLTLIEERVLETMPPLDSTLQLVAKEA